MKTKSPYAAYVCSTPEVAEADSETLECREDLSIVNISEKVPAPAHSGFPATVSNQKGGKSDSQYCKLLDVVPDDESLGQPATISPPTADTN